MDARPWRRLASVRHLQRPNGDFGYASVLTATTLEIGRGDRGGEFAPGLLERGLGLVARGLRLVIGLLRGLGLSAGLLLGILGLIERRAHIACGALFKLVF